MTEWCLAHPWMTFWLVMIAILVVEKIGASWRKP